MPKTPIPPRKKYIADPTQRPTVQYTDPIIAIPKNPFRAKYIQENIRLRVENEVARREQEAKNAYQHAKSLADKRASFREGVAAGYLKGLEAQIKNHHPGAPKDLKKREHNQRGYEHRVAKRARCLEANSRTNL